MSSSRQRLGEEEFPSSSSFKLSRFIVTPIEEEEEEELQRYALRRRRRRRRRVRRVASQGSPSSTLPFSFLPTINEEAEQEIEKVQLIVLSCLYFEKCIQQISLSFSPRISTS